VNHRHQRQWQIATGINDAGSKFATGVNDTGSKQWEQLSDCGSNFSLERLLLHMVATDLQVV
jgi:hypothetical protein